MPMQSDLNTVIWDFNGTLIDDLDLVVRTVNIQLSKRDLPPLTADAYRDVFGFPVEDYYRRIGVTFENESMADLSVDFFASYSVGLRDCPLHDGVVETLQQLKASDVRQFILSAMQEQMLHSIVADLGIASYFTGVYGLAHLKGDSKISRGHALMNDFNIIPSTALLIGDTDHDAEVAQELGLSVALISRGHQSSERLRDTGHLVCQSYQHLQQEIFPLD